MKQLPGMIKKDVKNFFISNKYQFNKFQQLLMKQRIYLQLENIKRINIPEIKTSKNIYKKTFSCF